MPALCRVRRTGWEKGYVDEAPDQALPGMAGTGWGHTPSTLGGKMQL
jgi:hypothetical protein